MSEAKHTPGPWVVARYGSKAFGLGTPGSSAFMLLRNIEGDIHEPLFQSNVYLVKAAPDLLEMIEELLADSASHHIGLDTRERARAAIAKAKGGAS